MEFKIKDLPEEGTLTASSEVISKLNEMGFQEEGSGEETNDSEDDATKDKKWLKTKIKK